MMSIDREIYITRDEFTSRHDRLEGKIDVLDARLRTLEERAIKLEAGVQVLTGELNAQNRQLETMQNIFSWGFALMAVVVVIAPGIRAFLREIFSPKIPEEAIRKIFADMLKNSKTE